MQASGCVFLPPFPPRPSCLLVLLPACALLLPVDFVSSLPHSEARSLPNPTPSPLLLVLPSIPSPWLRPLIATAGLSPPLPFSSFRLVHSRRRGRRRSAHAAAITLSSSAFDSESNDQPLTDP